MEKFELGHVPLYSVVLSKRQRLLKTDAVSGRWNSSGIPCVYAAGSISASLVEFSVHFDFRVIMRAGCVLEYSVSSEDIYEVTEKELPLGYRTLQHNPRCQDFGNRLLKEGKAVISFPSMFIPGERIYLINLLHEEMKSRYPTSIQLYQPW